MELPNNVHVISLRIRRVQLYERTDYLAVVDTLWEAGARKEAIESAMVYAIRRGGGHA